MKCSIFLSTALLASSGCCSILGDAAGGHQQPIQEDEKRLIQLSDTESRWILEDEKWELKRKGINFIDITDHPHVATQDDLAIKRTVKFPSKPAFGKDIKPLLKNLTMSGMETNLVNFTSFFTRYYKSDWGAKSSAWLLSQVKDTAKVDKHISVEPFPHSWPQSSIIAHIPGSKSNNTVVIGAHQDSINLYFPSLFAAPGADDDGSGTVTILEAFRVLVEAGVKPKNNLEFHWYSAEEGGLLGSMAIFQSYQNKKVPVVAMLQQDMTGYVKGTLDAGLPESVGVITDYVDPGLTAFIKEVITEYCDIPFVETKCGYACSDHASASKAGYPSAFVIESEFRNSDKKIHTTEDKISELSFPHMLQHAKLTLALAYELAMADFD